MSSSNDAPRNVQEAQKVVQQLQNELDQQTKKRKACQALVE